MEAENRKRESQSEIVESNMAEKECVYVPNWLVETLAWIPRTEMANSSLSTASSTFNRLCWPKLHGNVKKHSTQRLLFWYKQDEESFNPRTELRRSEFGCFNFPPEPNEYSIIPIASTKPPEYINEIGQMHLCFLDGQILKFVENILPLLNKIYLYFRIEVQRWDPDNIRIRPIRHLLGMLAPKTYQLCLCDFPININAFNRFFPGFIDAVQFIVLHLIREEWDLLLEWLKTGRMDGKHKLLQPMLIDGDECKFDFFKRIKQEFLCAKRPSTFIIELSCDYLPDLTLENAETGELLATYQNESLEEENFNIQYIVRHGKGMEHLRADWEKEFLEWRDGNSVGVQIEEIGVF